MSEREMLQESAKRLDLLYQFIERNRANLGAASSDIIKAMDAVWDAQSAVEQLIGDLDE